MFINNRCTVWIKYFIDLKILVQWSKGKIPGSGASNCLYIIQFSKEYAISLDCTYSIYHLSLHIQSRPSMTSLSIHTFFCLGRSISFLLHQKSMDQLKQKKVWIETSLTVHTVPLGAVCLPASNRIWLDLTYTQFKRSYSLS